MSIDLETITELCAAQGSIARVVVAEVKGSTPRDHGAVMYVWHDGQEGSIGGGALEHQATHDARRRLTTPQKIALSHIPLGPDLGQCCGGSVALVTEVFDSSNLPTGAVYARRVASHAEATAPLGLGLSKGWFSEAISPAKTPVWVWGAGHVGRALAQTLSPHPDFEVTLIDDSTDRMPPEIQGVTPLVAKNMPSLARYSPPKARHLVMTYDHAIDLELCAALLKVPHADVGLIGSATKWVRFKRRLSALGYSSAQINSIACPIGDPRVGKHPQAIAVSVATTLLLTGQSKHQTSDSQHENNQGAA